MSRHPGTGSNWYGWPRGGPGRPVWEWEEGTWQLGPGDRIGILGPNGAGKTTFLRLLAGDLGGVDARDPGAAAEVEGPVGAAGRVVRGKTVRLGFLGQGGEGLDPGLSAREVVAAVRGNLEAWE